MLKFAEGWIVDFRYLQNDQDLETSRQILSSTLSACAACTGKNGKPLEKVKLSVHPRHLVIGLANGWAAGPKSLFISPADVATSYTAGNRSAPRGYMFWDLGHEGLVPKNSSSGSPLYMATELNKFMHTRK